MNQLIQSIDLRIGEADIPFDVIKRGHVSLPRNAQTIEALLLQNPEISNLRAVYPYMNIDPALVTGCFAELDGFRRASDFDVLDLARGEYSVMAEVMPLLLQYVRQNGLTQLVDLRKALRFIRA